MAEEEIKKMLQAMIDQYNAAEFDAMANFYTTDCKVFTPVGVGEGRQHVADAIKKFHATGWVRQRMTDDGDVEVGDNIAAVIGPFYLCDDKGNDLASATSFCLMKKVDGKWLCQEETISLESKSVEDEIKDVLMLWEHLYDTSDFNQMMQTMYTANCRICPPGLPPFNGKHEVMTAFSLMKGFGIATIRNDIKGATVTKINDTTVYVSGGTFIGYNRHGGEMAKGRATTCFKKEDGKWKLHWDVFNTCA